MNIYDLIKQKELETDESPPVEEYKSILPSIKQLESTGGKFTNHRMMQSGIQKGTKGIGDTGLMPNTIKEFSQSDEDLKPLIDLDQDELEEKLKSNPELAEKLNKMMEDKLIRNMQGDKDRMAYGWQYGHNLKYNDVTPEMLDKSPRIQKFRKLQESISKKGSK